jgi:hypothetical protein
MRTLPAMMLHLLEPFAPLVSRRVWPYVQTLLAGAFPQPRGKEPLVAALRVMGLGQTKQFQPLPPCPKPCCLVGQGSEPCAAEIAREDVRA